MKTLDIYCMWFGNASHEVFVFKLVQDKVITASLQISSNPPLPFGVYLSWEGALAKVFEKARSWEVDECGLYPDLKNRPVGDLYRGIAQSYVAKAQVNGFTSFLILGNQSKYPTSPELEQFTKGLLKRIEEATGVKPTRNDSEIEFEELIDEERKRY